MKQKQKILFMGNEQLAQGIKPKTPIFKAILNADYEICGLILPTTNTRKPFAIDLVAKAHNIPVFYTKNSEELGEIIQKTQPDIALLAAYSKIIPDSIIDAIPHGIINIHPSLLPKYRGTTPIETALLNGDSKTGVSVMRIVNEMDAGPIFAQAEVDIPANCSKQALYEKLAQRASEIILPVLEDILQNNAKGEAQDETQASYTSVLSKLFSQLDTKTKGAAELAREVVAYAGFPKSKLNLLGKSCTISAAHAAPTAKNELDQLCADGNYLVIDELIPENSKAMSPSAFLNGFHSSSKSQHSEN